MGGNGLNTLEYSQKLKAVGVPPEQAEAHAMAIYEVINSELATKRDIKELEKNLSLKMVIVSGGFASLILSAIVALSKLGLMTPMP